MTEPKIRHQPREFAPTNPPELQLQLRAISNYIAKKRFSPCAEPVREALLLHVRLLNAACAMRPAEYPRGHSFDPRPSRLRLLACAAGLQSDAAAAEEMDEPSRSADLRAVANAILNAARVRGLIPRE